MAVARKLLRYKEIKNGIDFQSKVKTEIETGKDRYCKNLSKC